MVGGGGALEKQVICLYYLSTVVEKNEQNADIFITTVLKSHSWSLVGGYHRVYEFKVLPFLSKHVAPFSSLTV